MATVEHCLMCFEALSAKLEKRTPMTLSQVQSSWASYPKGLEEDEEIHSAQDSEAEVANRLTPRNPALQRLSESRNSTSSSGSSTPASSSSSNTLATEITTPGTSTENFSPVGLDPRKTQQRSEITESPLFVCSPFLTLPSHSKQINQAQILTKITR